MPDFSQTRSEYMKVMLGGKGNSLSPEQVNDVDTSSFDAAAIEQNAANLDVVSKSASDAGKKDKNFIEGSMDFITSVNTAYAEGIFSVIDGLWDAGNWLVGGLFGGGWFGADNALTQTTQKLASADWVSPVSRYSMIGPDFLAEAIKAANSAATGDDDYKGMFSAEYWDFGNAASNISDDAKVFGDDTTYFDVTKNVVSAIPYIALSIATGGQSTVAQVAVQAGAAAVEGAGSAFGQASSEGADFQSASGYAAAKGAINAALAAGTTALGGTLASKTGTSAVQKAGQAVGQAFAKFGENAEVTASAITQIILKSTMSAGRAATMAAIDPAIKQIYDDKAWYNAYGTEENRKNAFANIGKTALISGLSAAIINSGREMAAVAVQGKEQYKANYYKQLEESNIVRALKQADKENGTEMAKQFSKGLEGAKRVYRLIEKAQKEIDELSDGFDVKSAKMSQKLDEVAHDYFQRINKEYGKSVAPSEKSFDEALKYFNENPHKLIGKTADLKDMSQARAIGRTEALKELLVLTNRKNMSDSVLRFIAKAENLLDERAEYENLGKEAKDDLVVDFAGEEAANAKNSEELRTWLAGYGMKEGDETLPRVLVANASKALNDEGKIVFYNPYAAKEATREYILSLNLKSNLFMEYKKDPRIVSTKVGDQWVVFDGKNVYFQPVPGSEADKSNPFDVHRVDSYHNVEDRYDSRKYERRIVMMTPNEYYKLCAAGFRTTPEKLLASRRSDSLTKAMKQTPISEISSNMKGGEKYGMVTLTYNLDKRNNLHQFTQEGLHRMAAAGDVFGWDSQFPVVFASPKEKPVDFYQLKEKEGNFDGLIKRQLANKAKADKRSEAARAKEEADLEKYGMAEFDDDLLDDEEATPAPSKPAGKLGVETKPYSKEVSKGMKADHKMMVDSSHISRNKILTIGGARKVVDESITKFAAESELPIVKSDTSTDTTELLAAVDKGDRSDIDKAISRLADRIMNTTETVLYEGTQDEIQLTLNELTKDEREAVKAELTKTIGDVVENRKVDTIPTKLRKAIKNLFEEAYASASARRTIQSIGKTIDSARKKLAEFMDGDTKPFQLLEKVGKIRMSRSDLTLSPKSVNDLLSIGSQYTPELFKDDGFIHFSEYTKELFDGLAEMFPDGANENTKLDRETTQLVTGIVKAVAHDLREAGSEKQRNNVEMARGATTVANSITQIETKGARKLLNGKIGKVLDSTRGNFQTLEIVLGRENKFVGELENRYYGSVADETNRLYDFADEFRYVVGGEGAKSGGSIERKVISLTGKKHYVEALGFKVTKDVAMKAIADYCSLRDAVNEGGEPIYSEESLKQQRFLLGDEKAENHYVYLNDDKVKALIDFIGEEGSEIYSRVKEYYRRGGFHYGVMDELALAQTGEHLVDTQETQGIDYMGRIVRRGGKLAANYDTGFAMRGSISLPKNGSLNKRVRNFNVIDCSMGLLGELSHDTQSLIKAVSFRDFRRYFDTAINTKVLLPDGTRMNLNEVMGALDPNWGRNSGLLVRAATGQPLVEMSAGFKAINKATSNLINAILAGPSAIMKTQLSANQIMGYVGFRNFVEAESIIQRLAYSKEFRDEAISHIGKYVLRRSNEMQAVSAQIGGDVGSWIAKQFGKGLTWGDKMNVMTNVMGTAIHMANEATKSLGIEMFSPEWDKTASGILVELVVRTQTNTDPMTINKIRSGAVGPLANLLFGKFQGDNQNAFNQFEEAWLGQDLYEQRKKAYEVAYEKTDKMSKEAEAKAEEAKRLADEYSSKSEQKRAEMEAAEDEKAKEKASKEADKLDRMAEEARREQEKAEKEKARADAWRDSVKEAHEKGEELYSPKASNAKKARVSAMLLITGIMATAITSSVSVLMGNKKPEEAFDPKEFWIKAGVNSTFGWMPYVNQISNTVLNNTDMNYVTIDEINALKTDVTNLIQGLQTGNSSKIAGATNAFVRQLVKFMGIPLDNAYKLVRGIVKNFSEKAYIDAFGWLDGMSENTLSKEFREYASKGDISGAAASLRLIYSMSKTGEAGWDTYREMAKLYSEGETGFLPRSIPTYYVDSNGEQQSFTDSQKYVFVNEYRKANKTVEKAISSSAYRGMSSTAKAKMIKKLYDAFYSAAKAKALGSESDSRLGKLIQYSGGDAQIAEHILLMQMVSESVSKLQSGKKEQAVRMVNASTLTKGGKLLVLTLLGYGVGSGSSQTLKSYLKSLGFSSKEAEAFMA